MRNLEKYKWVSGCCEQNVLPKLCPWWWNYLALRYTAWNRSFLKREYSVKQGGGGGDRNFFSKGVEMNVLQHNGKKGGPPPPSFLSRYLDPLFNPIPLTGWRRRRRRGGEVVTDLINRLYGKKGGKEEKKAAYVEWIYGSVHGQFCCCCIFRRRKFTFCVSFFFYIAQLAFGLLLVKYVLAHPVFPPCGKEEVKK